MKQILTAWKALKGGLLEGIQESGIGLVEHAPLFNLSTEGKTAAWLGMYEISPLVPEPIRPPGPGNLVVFPVEKTRRGLTKPLETREI